LSIYISHLFLLPALQALLHTIAPADQANKVSPEALQRLSAGLKNLLGDEGSDAFLQTRHGSSSSSAVRGYDLIFHDDIIAQTKA